MLKKLFSFLRDNYLHVYNIFLFICALIIISAITPRESAFTYNFVSLQNKPWLHEDLVSPFDFSVHKEKELVDKEKQEILKSARLYFRKNNFSSAQILSKLKSNIQTDSITLSNETKEQLSKTSIILEDVYKKGIIQIPEFLEEKSEDFSITCIQDETEEELYIGNFYSIPAAYDYIISTLEKDPAINVEFVAPIVEENLVYNVVFDSTSTYNKQKNLLENVSENEALILKDQIIISKGEIVNDNKIKLLNSLKYETEKRNSTKSYFNLAFIGYFLLIATCLLMLFMFIKLFRNDIYQNHSKVLFILTLTVVMVISSFIVTKINLTSIYILPFCIIPIIVRAFFDTRLALFVHLITILLCSFFSINKADFLFIEIIAGIVAIYGSVNLKKRSQFFTTSILLLLSYFLLYSCITIIQENSIDFTSKKEFLWFAISSTFTLFAYPSIFILERLFGYVSDVSLIELCDTNNELLRELATKAPGTFHHSIQVANLAEEAIREIGGNTLLTRAGALYHDIGKTDIPLYFIENQSSGINVHEEIDHEESSAIIISHVIRGIEKARKNKLPEQVIDFIRTHHGTTRTKYFYEAFKKQFPEVTIEDHQFRYKGPLPFSKETAVLMMADSIEAASRSLKEYSSEKLTVLIDAIIENQIKEKQFTNTDITFKDITTLKKVFRKKLASFYHNRIEYRV